MYYPPRPYVAKLDHYLYVIFRHSFGRYPTLSELSFGRYHGCFEKPDEDKDPTKEIDCPDITPLKFSNNKTNRDAMRNESPLVHPDAKGLTKYCLGTGLQMREGKKSHQLKTCEYHDVKNCSQGKLLKTMTQEAMQVRVFQTISVINLSSISVSRLRYYSVWYLVVQAIFGSN